MDEQPFQPEFAENRRRPLRADRLLESLVARGVEFVVIGGFSLAAHGIVRATNDLDIVPSPEDANLRKLAAALLDIDAQPMLADDFELPLRPDADGLAAGGNWVLTTQFGRLDVMQFVDGVAGYHQLRNRATAAVVPGVGTALMFASVDDLIAMKTAAGRPQDLLDIADLERARSVADAEH